MFSELGPLFKTQLRLAEKADTRLEIRREERDEQGKKHDDTPEDEAASTFWEDSTEVSVDALKAFLIGFLTSRGDAVPEAPTPAQDIAAAPAEYRPPVNTRTARAVKAYSSMAAQTLPPSMPPQPAETQESEDSVDLVDLLAADELRTMHVLISELDLLSRKGVQTLTIEKADSFLSALVMAVRAEKLKS